MRLVAVRGNENEFGEAVILPGGEELVEGAMERLLAECGGARVCASGTDIHTVVYCGRTEHTEFPGEVDREMSRDQHIGAEWQVRAVLFQRADRDDEAGVAREQCCDVDPAELVETQTCFLFHAPVDILPED